MIKNITKQLSEIWSISSFVDTELNDYALESSIKDTRRGLLVLSMVMLILLVAQAGLFRQLGFDTSYLYTTSLLALLAAHIYISASALKEVRTLYTMGMTLLVISGTAFVLLAHQTGTFDLAMFAAVSLLFMLIPLIPWGIREAGTVILMVYGLMTVSVLTKPGDFDMEAMIILQFIMFGASIISLVLVARNMIIRRDDIQARFELEKARDRLMHLSNRDPLSGAWNRRYLKDNFKVLVKKWYEQGKSCHFAFLDIDDFKPINDTFGHEYGDKVIKWVSAAFQTVVSDQGVLIRMGGDEFALLFCGDSPVNIIDSCMSKLQNSIHSDPINHAPYVSLSVGLISFSFARDIDMSQIYQKADMALYEAKESKVKQGIRENYIIHNQLEEVSMPFLKVE